MFHWFVRHVWQLDNHWDKTRFVSNECISHLVLGRKVKVDISFWLVDDFLSEPNKQRGALRKRHKWFTLFNIGQLVSCEGVYILNVTMVIQQTIALKPFQGSKTLFVSPPWAPWSSQLVNRLLNVTARSVHGTAQTHKTQTNKGRSVEICRESLFDTREFQN